MSLITKTHQPKLMLHNRGKKQLLHTSIQRKNIQEKGIIIYPDLLDFSDPLYFPVDFFLDLYIVYTHAHPSCSM